MAPHTKIMAMGAGSGTRTVARSRAASTPPLPSRSRRACSEPTECALSSQASPTSRAARPWPTFSTERSRVSSAASTSSTTLLASWTATTNGAWTTTTLTTRTTSSALNTRAPEWCRKASAISSPPIRGTSLESRRAFRSLSAVRTSRPPIRPPPSRAPMTAAARAAAATRPGLGRWRTGWTSSWFWTQASSPTPSARAARWRSQARRASSASSSTRTTCAPSWPTSARCASQRSRRTVSRPTCSARTRPSSPLDASRTVSCPPSGTRR
mmetsp:Transcript_20093/g.50899  ORF Transcript_20093/g.50899 Transcript_20093/m.50899 type:complete len:269 (-) Transcript_20093:381-1187(-)